MIIFKKAENIKDFISEQKSRQSIIGFVPTMGALHEGHLSLVKKAKADGGIAIASIYVNPTQFNDKKDFDKYPKSTEADIEMLIDAGCDILFLPSTEEVYPKGVENAKAYDFGYLDTILEGAHRPGHFRGMGQVVAILLNIVQPHYLYLGQKDYQQCLAIKKLVSMMGMDDLHITICSTVREADGLAMSSRNRRLTDAQRAVAGTIYQCLVSIQSKQSSGNFSVIQKECIDLLKEKGFEPEYVALADARDLTLFENYSRNIPMVALIAAKLGDIRLIDNNLLAP